MSDGAVIVDESELPQALRGRFIRVFIKDDASGKEGVYFAIDDHPGIVCDCRKQVGGFFFALWEKGFTPIDTHAFEALKACVSNQPSLG